MLAFGVIPTLLRLLHIAAELLGGILGLAGGVVSRVVGSLARFARGFVRLFLTMPFPFPSRVFVVGTLASNQRDRTQNRREDSFSHALHDLSPCQLDAVIEPNVSAHL
jgi:hypothetical protein